MVLQAFGIRHSGTSSDFAGINQGSADVEAAVTRIQGLTTWAAHGIYGLAVIGALGVGLHAVGTGSMALGHLLVFVLYALTLRAPCVQLARQGARTGKILACGYRLCEVLAVGKTNGSSAASISRAIV